MSRGIALPFDDLGTEDGGGWSAPRPDVACMSLAKIGRVKGVIERIHDVLTEFFTIFVVFRRRLVQEMRTKFY